MSQILLPSDPPRTHISLDVISDTLPVKLIDSPKRPISLSKRLRRTLSFIWRDAPVRLMLIIVLSFLAIALTVTHYFSLTIITPEENKSFTTGGYTIGYTIEYPANIAAYEADQLLVTLVNRNVISLTQVSAILVFSNAIPVTSDTTVAQFEDLAPGERKTRVIHFTLNQPIDHPVDQPIWVELQARADQLGNGLLHKYALNIAPFPRLKTMGRWLGGSLFTGLGGVLLWMLLKDAFQDAFSEK